MFGFFGKKKVQKVNLSSIAETLDRRHYSFQLDASNNVIRIEANYLNNDFKRRQYLFLHFFGEKIRMEDAFGNVMSIVPKEKMFPELKNILGIV